MVKSGVNTRVKSGANNRWQRRWLTSLGGTLCLWGFGPLLPLMALPPANDIPEEVLRSQLWNEAQGGEIILERSPLNGQVLTIPEVLEKQAQADNPTRPEPKVAPILQQKILLLRLRKFLKSLIPF